MDTDPTALLMTTGYFAAALGCGWSLRVARIGARRSRDHRVVERRRHDRVGAYRASCAFWTILLVLMALLGVNKSLDLHFALTRLARELASEQGWYPRRQVLQAAFAGSILLGGFVLLAVLLRRTRELLPRHALAFAGVVLLGAFLAARALSFHELDAWLYRPVCGIEARVLLEFAGVLAIGGCAWNNARWYGTPTFLGRSVQEETVSDDSSTAARTDRAPESR